MMIKENRSADMERDNKITVIINSKNAEDAKELYTGIMTMLRKERRRRNKSISFNVLCVAKK